MANEPEESEAAKTFTMNYPGNCIDIVGNIIGPTPSGFFKVIAATHHTDTDITHATLSPARDPRGDFMQWWDRELNPVDPPENFTINPSEGPRR